MVSSTPRFPPFSVKEPAFVFALWLRDKLHKDDELKRYCAHLLGVSVDTLTHYTRGDGCHPTFNSAMTLLWALDGHDEFWVRLADPEESMTTAIIGAAATVRAKRRRMAHHPPRAEREATLDALHDLIAAATELCQAIRADEPTKAVDEEPERDVRLVPRRIG